jgi:hypothetical protein
MTPLRSMIKIPFNTNIDLEVAVCAPVCDPSGSIYFDLLDDLNQNKSLRHKNISILLQCVEMFFFKKSNFDNYSILSIQNYPKK